MSPLKPSFAQMPARNTGSAGPPDWRPSAPQRSRPVRRRTPHAQFVMRALDLFPGSVVLESFPHPQPPTAEPT